MKITLLSRSREAKTLLRCRTLRDANKDSKSTCSSLESRGRRSSMTFWREKDHRSVSSHRALMLWEQGPDRYFSSSQALPAVLTNTTCCSVLKHKPSKGLPQIVLPDDAEDYPESTSMRTAWDQHKYALLGWRQGALHKEGKPVCVQLGMVSRLSGTQAAEWHRAFTIFTLFLQMVFISGCLTYWPYTFIPLQKRVTCESFPFFTATSVIPVTAPWPFILLILDRSS